MEKKMTKKDVLNAIATLVNENEGFEVGIGDGNDKITVTAEDILNYVEITIDQLNTKAAKAKERAAAVKAEGDEIRVAVQAVLTNELQTIDAITAQVNVPEITKSKVTARLTQLIKAEIAYKEQVKTEDGRKVMAYALVLDPTPVEE